MITRPHIMLFKMEDGTIELLYTTGHEVVQPPEQADEVMEEVLPPGITKTKSQSSCARACSRAGHGVFF